MINIESSQPVKSFALFNLGFRIFFLAAGLHAFVTMFLWMGVNLSWWQLNVFSNVQLWHAHEMVFGYALAVIAGFLLTAVKNWTSQQTLHGPALAVLFIFWLLARILPFIHGISLSTVTVVDSLFVFMLMVSVAYPVLKARQKQHLFILLILVFMFVAQLVFYLGLQGIITDGIRMGLYSGIYLVLGMIFLMGRRVIPFFIEKGVGYPLQLTNYRWIDAISPVVFVLFWISDVFTSQQNLVSVLALFLAVMHGIRLIGWHSYGIWKKPLLWSIYLAYAFLPLGFLLKAFAVQGYISPFIALHAFTVGGIALMTQGMMSRVTIGHTGRNVFEPPPILLWIFALLFASALIRVFAAVLVPANYSLWISLSQVLWILSFAAFILQHLAMWLKPRIDGRPG